MVHDFWRKWFLRGKAQRSSLSSRRRMGEKGFSLIELLVVISIIMFLTSIVLTMTSVVRKKSRDARRTLDMQNITTALALYQDAHQYFPCTTQDSRSANFLDFLVNEGYLTKSPQDPINSNVYFYGYETTKATPTGHCGYSAFIWYYTEQANNCTFGAQVGSYHCHYFFPEPLRCSDPFSKLEWGAPDCTHLH